MLLVHAWAVIAGAMILYAVWPSVLTLLISVAVIGARQLGLMVLVHEAVHWRLFEHARSNNLAAQWLCAFPIWGELPAYRRRHHLHHRYTLEAEDPDLPLLAPFPITGGTFWMNVARDLAGITACVRVIRWPAWRGGATVLWRALRGPVAANLVIFGVLAALGQWQLYLLLWLLPLATWYQLASRIRDTA